MTSRNFTISGKAANRKSSPWTAHMLWQSFWMVFFRLLEVVAMTNRTMPSAISCTLLATAALHASWRTRSTFKAAWRNY